MPGRDEPTLFDAAADASTDGGQHPFKPGRRTKQLAGFLAGWRWPGGGSFDRLPKAKQAAAMKAARMVEEFLAEGDGQ